MRTRIIVLGLLVVGGALAVVAVESRAGAAATAGPTYYGDVKPILDGRCTGCHMSGGIAPFSLTSYANARKYRGLIAQAVRTRKMPPWHAQRGVRSYLHDPSLTNAQISAIVRWAEQGARAGSPQQRGKPVAPIPSGLSRVDLELKMQHAYTPRRGSTDDYRCFVLGWSPASPTYVTGADIAPGARKLVHHIIVYLAPPSASAQVDRWDAEDRGPGYRCYGGPSAAGEQGNSINFMAGWAPGAGGGDFPAGTGQRIAPGSRLIMQVHYNVNGARRPAPDRSTVRLNLAPSVERRAVYVPVVDLAWLAAPQTFSIPAGRKRVTHAFTGDFSPLVRYLGGFDPSRGLTAHSVALHMHRLGETARLDVVRSTGARETLLAIQRWDFNWQRDYRLAEPEQIAPGDRLSIRCTHDNTAANQPVIGGRRSRPRHVTWGEDSSDEMCIGFVYVSER